MQNWFFDHSYYHVYSLHTLLELFLCEYHPRSRRCVTYSTSSWPLYSSSPFSSYTLHSFSSWQTFWSRMLLLIIIGAKACLGWSLCVLRHFLAGDIFWSFKKYNFQDRDGAYHCEVSSKASLKWIKHLSFFFFFESNVNRVVDKFSGRSYEKMEIIGPQMVLTMKMITFGWNVYDGRRKVEVRLSAALLWTINLA